MASRSEAQTTLTQDEQTLWNAWQERVRRYRAGDTAALPAEVDGLGDLRVFGRAGDAVIAFPRVRRLSDLELLPADVQIGLAVANRTVTAHRAAGAGRMVYATAPATNDLFPDPETVDAIDPSRHTNILIVAPISGGCR